MMGQELTDFIVVNYTKPDRDSSIHFLTDVMANSWKELISPSASIVYTSSFNSWYLKKILKVKDTTIIGVDIGKSHPVSYNGNKFTFCFIDSKSSTGSVSLFVSGDFGVYFYTGNFCYYNGFTTLMCSQMKEIISYKSLSRLYFDATYYEQKSQFMDYDELVGKVGRIVCQGFSRRTYIVIDIFGLEMLLIDIALYVRKKFPEAVLHVGSARFHMMCILGYRNLFTCNFYDSRIYIRSPDFLRRKLDNKAFYNLISIKRKSELCQDFESYVQINGWHEFTFYSHSSHERCCTLINLFKPEILIPTHSLTVNSSLITFPNFSDFSIKEDINSSSSNSETKSKVPGLILKSKIKEVNHSNFPCLKNIEKKRLINDNILSKKEISQPSTSGYTSKKIYSRHLKSEKKIAINKIKDLPMKIAEGLNLSHESNDKTYGTLSFKLKRELFKQLLQFNINYGKISFKYKPKNQISRNQLKKLKIIPTPETIKKLFLNTVRYGNICLRQKSANKPAQRATTERNSKLVTKTHLKEPSAEIGASNLDEQTLDPRLISVKKNKSNTPEIIFTSELPMKNLANEGHVTIDHSNAIIFRAQNKINSDSNFNLRKIASSGSNPDLILSSHIVYSQKNVELSFHLNVAAFQKRYEDLTSGKNSYSGTSIGLTQSESHYDSKPLLEKEQYKLQNTSPSIISKETNRKQNLLGNVSVCETKKRLVVNVDDNLEASSGYFYSHSDHCYLPIIYKNGFKGFLKSDLNSMKKDLINLQKCLKSYEGPR